MCCKLLLLLTALVACSPYGQLSPGMRQPATMTEGWLALGVDCAHGIMAVDLCPREGGSCVATGPYQKGVDMKLLLLPAGTWCIERIIFTDSLVEGAVWEGAHICMPVLPRRVNYPGHHGFRLVGWHQQRIRATHFLVDHADAMWRTVAHDYPIAALPAAATEQGG